MRLGTRCLIIKLLTLVGMCSAQDPRLLAPANPAYGQLPLVFEANRGQTDPRVKFLSRGEGYTAFLTVGDIVLSLRPSEVTTSRANENKAATPSKRKPIRTLEFKLVGATENPVIVGEDEQPGRVNYFIGNDRSKWRTNVLTYRRVRYKSVYSGIDLVYYGNHRQLEYDFVIAPHANPDSIQFEIKGASQVTLGSKGDLIVKMDDGELHFQSPTVYQESNGIRMPRPGQYVMKSPTRVGFHVPNFDREKPLVIDPVLLYSTYLGGSGDDQPTGVAVDSNGSVYVAGYTTSTDFPLAAFGSLSPGSNHVFVAKFDPSGSNLLYSDYIGGNSDDFGFALAVDSSNDVYVTGSTGSSNFPVVNAYQGTYPGSFNGFLTKISSDGSSLVYSTYLGGNGSDIPLRVALDISGQAAVAGYTSSTNFPVSNAYQSTVSPNQGGLYGDYGFLTKFTSDGLSLVYSTYLGGSSNIALSCGGVPCWPSPETFIYGMVLDSFGDAFLAGETNTYDFPVTQGAYLTTNSAQPYYSVGFVSKISSSGSLQYSTYFYDPASFTDITAIAVDGSGSAYVTGLSFSDGSLPITSTGICDPGISGAACGYTFVTKFDATLSTLAYSTFLGPNNYAVPLAIVLDQSNDAYVFGTTSSSTYSTVNGLESFAGGNDALLVEIDPVAGSQLFSTYLGGSANEAATAMAIDAGDNLYLTGITNSTDFPTTQQAFQGQSGGNNDGFVVKVAMSSAPLVSLAPSSVTFSSQPVGTTSPGQQVVLRNMGGSALTISSITSSGDFADTNNCGTSVPAGGSCTLSVTFSPTAAGLRSGSISISDDAAGSPHVVSLSGTGSAAIAVVSPTSLTFPSTPVGVSSAAQTITLQNQGNASLNISNVQITGDFGQISNCPSILAPSSSCTFNVVFTPTATGTRTGILTITDDAAGSPQTVALSGTSSATAGVSLTPVSLSFPSTAVGTLSSVQTVSLLNQGGTSLSISRIQVTGDYKQTNTCSSTVGIGSGCTISVTFAPTGSGSRSGAITISDSAAGSPQTVPLSGNGADFSLGVSPTSSTVKAGVSTTYSLTISPVGGAFGNQVKLSCGGAPASSTCSLSATSITPGSSPATVKLTITTTSSSAEARPPLPIQSRPLYAVWIQLQSLGVFGMFVAGSKRSRKKLPVLILLALLISAVLFIPGCAGGTGIVPTGGSGTPPGTYPITITATSGSLQHSAQVTLIVQ